MAVGGGEDDFRALANHRFHHPFGFLVFRDILGFQNFHAGEGSSHRVRASTGGLVIAEVIAGADVEKADGRAACADSHFSFGRGCFGGGRGGFCGSRCFGGWGRRGCSTRRNYKGENQDEREKR